MASTKRRTRARKSPSPRAPASTADGGRRGLGFYGYVVRDVMSRPVITVRPEASLEAAASLMSTHGVSGLPVIDRRPRLVGVLSQKDIVRVLHERAGLSLPGGIFDLILDSTKARRSDLPRECRTILETARVRHAMSSRPITVNANASLDDAIRLLIEHRINRLPVMENGSLVGIVSRHDLLSGFL
ncbi:MAG TPA: CBS domain-containing protein [Thermoplasmata archaeon]|nr:CBS domain-containing protein [Thermoplasmata archaeon]